MVIFRDARMRILIISLFLFASTYTEANDNCNLYPQLIRKHCVELLTIQEHYSQYNAETKYWSLVRAKEIKQGLLNEKEKIDFVLKEIAHAKIDQIPITIINDVINHWKVYFHLTEETKRKLIKYSLNTKDKTPSDEIVSFIENRQPFITPSSKTDPAKA